PPRARPPLPTRRSSELIEADLRSYTADGYTHFMRKEIHEQPRTVERALRGRIEERFHTAHLGGLNIDAREARAIRRVKILGCGSDRKRTRLNSSHAQIS